MGMDVMCDEEKERKTDELQSLFFFSFSFFSFFFLFAQQKKRRRETNLTPLNSTNEMSDCFRSKHIPPVRVTQPTSPASPSRLQMFAYLKEVPNQSWNIMAKKRVCPG